MTTLTARTNAPENQLSRGRRWACVSVLCATILVVMMDMTILNIAIPHMATDLNPTSTQLLWIVDVYSLVLAGLLVSMGSIGDRIGRKRLLMIGYAIFAIASLLVLWAPTAGAVIGIRVLLGVGGAMLMPTTLSLIRTVFHDPQERAAALGMWAAVSSLGAAVGPLVGGFVVEHLSWHGAFLINVPVMVAAFVAGGLILPESRAANPGRWDWFGALLSLAGMVALVWGIKHFAESMSFGAWEAWEALGIAAVLLGFFAWRSLHIESPLLDFRIFKSRVFSGGLLAAFGSAFAGGIALLLLAQWMQSVAGLTPVDAGLGVLPMAASAMVASLVAPHLARRVPPRAVLAGGIAAAGVGMLGVFFVPGDMSYGWLIVPLCLIGVGSGSLAIASAFIMSGTPESRAGNAAAMEETSYELASLLGIATLGSVASVLYRTWLGASGVLTGLTDGDAGAAQESIAAAMRVSEEIGGPGGADLASGAATAFTDSTQVTYLLGGLVMLGFALAIRTLVPRGVTLGDQVH